MSEASKTDTTARKPNEPMATWAEIDAALRLVRDAKIRRRALGLSTDLSPRELDRVLPPVDCRRTRQRLSREQQTVTFQRDARPHQINLKLSDAELAELGRLARRTGARTRTGVLRVALDLLSAKYPPEDPVELPGRKRSV